MCDDAESLCSPNIATIQEQWRVEKFDLGKVVIFSQQPDLHIRIEAFFSGVKSLLDLVVQLLTTERIVSGSVDGFHREKKVYGGRVLNALKGNALKDKKDIAEKLYALISEHKSLWIDQLILARDLLVHPARGMHQLMFVLEFAERNGFLVCVNTHPPQIESQAVHSYALRTFEQITAFSNQFLALARGATSV